MTEPTAEQPAEEPAEEQPGHSAEELAEQSVLSEPTAEQLAERSVRADKASRGVLAGTLGLEALVVLLLPRALAATSSGLGLTKTLILVGFAVVLIAVAGMVRRPQGIAIGSVMQILLMLTGILLTVMFVVALIFWAVWYRVLVLRRDVVGTPGGVRIFVS